MLKRLSTKEISKRISYEQNLFSQINKARTNPNFVLNKLLHFSKSEISEESNTFLNYKYNEPILSLIDNATKFIKEQSESPKLIFSEGISESCHDLLNAITLHYGMNIDDYGGFEDRIAKYGFVYGYLGEVVDYGSRTPFDVIMNIFLGDGDKSKSQRKMIMNHKFKYVGICNSKLPDGTNCTIIAFAQHFFENYKSIPDDLLMKISNRQNKKRKVTVIDKTKGYKD